MQWIREYSKCIWNDKTTGISQCHAFPERMLYPPIPCSDELDLYRWVGLWKTIRFREIPAFTWLRKVRHKFKSFLTDDDIHIFPQFCLTALSFHFQRWFRKFLISGIMKPMWFSCPSIWVTILVDDIVFSIMIFMSLCHTVCLSMVSAIDSECVFISHPNIVLISSIFPSPANFFKERKSSWGVGSNYVSGCPTMCSASGTAAAHCSAFMPMSTQMGGMSLMYMSTRPKSLIGKVMAISFACLNGISGASLFSSGIRFWERRSHDDPMHCTVSGHLISHEWVQKCSTISLGNLLLQMSFIMQEEASLWSR